MIRRTRIVAALLGLAVLAWQVVNAARGRFVHAFLIPDLVIAPALIIASAWPNERRAALGMLAGYSAMAGVFLAATTGRLIVEDSYDLGTTLTTAGLLPCVICAVGLARWLNQRMAGSSPTDVLEADRPRSSGGSP